MQNTTHTLQTDCLIVGGGPAGYGAMMAFLGSGNSSAILVERHGFIGGMGTAAGLSSYLNHRIEGFNVGDSVYRKLVQDLKNQGGSYYDPVSMGDYFEPEVCKSVMESNILKAGGTIVYHSFLSTVEKEGDFWIAGFLSKGASIKIKTRYLVDCTGDGDAAQKAGATMTHGRKSDGMAQPMSMVVQLGGFDPQAWSKAGHRLLDDRYALNGDCFEDEIADAKNKGLWSIPRENIALLWSMPADPSRVTINGTRIQGLSACDPLQMTAGEIEGRRQALVLRDFFRQYIPGFSDCYIVNTGPQLGVRESRRIVGMETLSEEHVLKGERPKSSIAFCSYPIDIHDSDGSGTQFDMGNHVKIYGIGWPCLLPESLSNLVVAGRCISASHEAAGSFRVMPTCMGLGQAAGTGVAMALESKKELRSIEGSEIRTRIETDPESFQSTALSNK